MFNTSIGIVIGVGAVITMVALGTGAQTVDHRLDVEPGAVHVIDDQQAVPGIEGLEHLQRWLKAMYARPACVKGIEVPFKLPPFSLYRALRRSNIFR